jgi:hypothetical protein
MAFKYTYVRSFRGAGCDTDHYLVVAKVRERLAVGKQASQKTDTERFNVKKLNKGDVKEQYQVTIRNKFAAVENLEGSGDIHRAWTILGYQNCGPRESRLL